MRPRLLPFALVLASAAILAPRSAVAQEKAQESTSSKAPAPGTAPVTGAPLAAAVPLAGPQSPIRAAMLAESQPRPAVSPALVIAGGITAAAGGVTALAGLIVMNVDTTGCSGSACSSARRDAGRIALFAGAPVLAAGLTMVIIGIQPAPDAAGEPQARLVPTVTLGPTGGALRWSF